MDIKDIVKDKTCYIISNELKSEILSYMNDNKLLLDIHFFSLPEIIEKIYFKYDKESIYYISKKFNLSFSNAKLMINNLYYLIYSNNINNEKINYLKSIKEYLDSLNLLHYDDGFLSYLKSYNIVSDLDVSDTFLYRIYELLDKNITFIRSKENNEVRIHHFENSDKEIGFIANEIADLINKEINPEKIHILNYSKEYDPYIDKIFSMYNIPYKLNSDNKLYNLEEIKLLYNSYLNGEELNASTDLASTFYSMSDSVSFIDEKKEREEYLLYLLKNTKVSNNKYKNIISFSSYETFYLNDHHYFFIGLNNKMFPKYKKDEDFLSDKIKSELGYLTSFESNKLKREYSLNHLKCKNLFISYRDSDYFNNYLKSDLIDELGIIVKDKKNENRYSKEYDKLLLTRELDDFYKYNKKSNELIELLNRLGKDDYNTYDNSYSKVNNYTYLTKILDNKINISYSSFEKFNECNYKYYLDSILNENESRFTTYIGNLFHYILEKIYEKDFDFESVFNSYSEEYILNEKEKLLLNNLIEDFKEKIKIILEQYNKGNFKRIEKEKRISIKVKSNLSINIKGFIDKIMFDDENNAYIVDYKTGDTKLTLDYLDYGLKCQLPFYFYLMKHSNEYANVFLVGCYLQVINFKIHNYKDNDKELLLEGYSFNNAEIIEKIDNFYANESFIKGIKPNKNGLGTYAKTYDEEEFNKIISKMDDNIKNMINDISNVNFNINPKILKNKVTTCQYCNYKDICYKSFKDYIDVRKVNENESEMD